MIKSSAESCTECGSVLRGTEKFCPSCGNCVSPVDTSDEIALDTTLPISLDYPEAIKVNIDNPSTVKISKADLEFYTYYVIEYKIDIQRIDPSGKKHNLQNHEIVIVDATNAELLSDTKRTMEFVRIRKRKGKTEERKWQIVPKRHETGIKRKSLVYVPKWKISFRSGDFEYKRTALAPSCIFIVDEIALCPMHSSLAKIWNRQKRSIAVCEICGGAFCNDHIFRINQMYYCKDHLPSDT